MLVLCSCGCKDRLCWWYMVGFGGVVGVVGGVLCWYVVLWSYMLVLVGGFMV